jgi:Flp pilus assembly protein TadG
MARKRSLIGQLLSSAHRGRRTFSRDENGAVVIEFAFLAPIFFALVYAILETSITFLAGQILDSAVQDASREIRTGSGDAANVTLFRAEVCERLYGMFDCADLKIRVETISTFASTTVTTPVNNDPNCDDPDTPDDYECWTITEAYSAGAASSIMLVQVFYRWPTLVNLGVDLGSLPGGGQLLSAVRVFKNEPF